MSNSVILSWNIVLVIPSVGGGWYNPIRCIGVIQYDNPPSRTLVEHRQAFIQYPGVHQV